MQVKLNEASTQMIKYTKSIWLPEASQERTPPSGGPAETGPDEVLIAIMTWFIPDSWQGWTLKRVTRTPETQDPGSALGTHFPRRWRPKHPSALRVGSWVLVGLWVVMGWAGHL